MEYLDVVNEKDEVIGKETRPDVYKKALGHRVVHIFVFNEVGELALQLRSATSSYRPHHWGSTAAGHVQTGETYEEAAKRELEEEVGIKAPIEFLDKFYYTAEGYKKFLGVFKAKWNDALTSTSEEGSDIRFIAIPKIKSMERDGTLFMPETLFILEKLYGTNK